MRKTCLALLLTSLSLPAAANPVPGNASLRQEISGQWASTAPESYDHIHATRHFSLTSRRWAVKFQVYADAGGTQPLFHLNVGGPYTLGGPSATVAGATEGIFPADHRLITADSPAAVQLFASQGCTLQLGKPLALTTHGCGFVPGLMQNMGEYDLVALKEGQLFFGDRRGDLSKGRPDKLTPYPLQRQPAR